MGIGNTYQNIKNHKEICKECNETGSINMIVTFNDNKITKMTCFVCQGNKEFLWIDIIKGRNKKLEPGFYVQDISIYKKTDDEKWVWDFESNYQ